VTLAITGGTGFVGSHLIEAALATGNRINALTRRRQPPREGLRWIEGALDDPASLAALCDGCDAVIHVAGVINGDADAFHQGNVIGTENMVAAAAQTGIRRFVHISSLAAREPKLSTYGKSKCESEEPIIATAGDWTIIRPPAIYGPRDREMLDLFRFAKRHVLPLPVGVRLSIVHVSDLVRLILTCLEDPRSHGRTYEPDDGREGGWPARELGQAVGRAVGARVVVVPLPKPLLLAGVRIDRAVRGRNAKLTRDRVDYFCHPDWTAAPHAQPPAELWRPQIRTEDGLAATARWYRAKGWL
jgi:nucleoside-diphosphate-sugar epimerase